MIILLLTIGFLISVVLFFVYYFKFIVKVVLHSKKLSSAYNTALIDYIRERKIIRIDEEEEKPINIEFKEKFNKLLNILKLKQKS